MKMQETLAILEKWKDRDELFITLSPPFEVTFEVDRTLLKTVLEESATSEREFRETASEISLILLNILNGTEDSYIETSGDEPTGRPSAGPPGDEQQRTADMQAVRSCLYDERLQQRYNMKRSSKEPSFNRVDWDVKVKVHDNQLDIPRPIPCATISLSFQKEFEDSALAVMGGKTFGSTQIDFSLEEVDHLIRTLSVVRERLAGLEGSPMEPVPVES